MVQTEKNEIDKGRQRRGPILMVIDLVEENAQPVKKEMGECGVGGNREINRKNED